MHYSIVLITVLFLSEYQVRSIASHVRPDRQSMYMYEAALEYSYIYIQNEHLFYKYSQL